MTKPEAPEEIVNHFDTAIVGTRFRGALAIQIVGSLIRGSRVRLVREPDNPHDPNAISVYWGELYHLGYIPRADNQELARIFAGRRASELVAEVMLEAVVQDGQIKFAPKIRISNGER